MHQDHRCIKIIPAIGSIRTKSLMSLLPVRSSNGLLRGGDAEEGSEMRHAGCAGG